MKNFYLLWMLSLWFMAPIMGQETQEAFITTWEVVNPSEPLSIQLNSKFTYNFEYRWEKEDSTVLNSGEHTAADGSLKLKNT